MGTDLELTIRVRVPADTDDEGSAVVPARLFSEIVRQLDGDTVSVELADDDAKIEAGRFATTLRTLSAAEFPRLPEAGEGGVRVEAAAFAEALRQVVPGASRDDAAPDPDRRVAHRVDPVASASSPPTPTGWRCATSRVSPCSRRARRSSSRPRV